MPKLMLKPFLLRRRDSYLRWLNVRRISRVLREHRSEKQLPVFIIASPPDMHLAPYSLRNPPSYLCPIIIGNGLTQCDIQWILRRCGKTPVVSLCASLSGNVTTYLSHAEVIHAAFAACRSDFCLQDADCLVLDNGIWSRLASTASNFYAAGPFQKETIWPGQMMPDTYLVKIIAHHFKSTCLKWKVDARISRAPGKKLTKAFIACGRGPAVFPEFCKDYYDTLQKYWVAAAMDNLAFECIPGAGESVFHIGGSSYITGRIPSDLAHWDFWPANTIYFHLAFIERSGDEMLRNRFSHLFTNYGSSSEIVKLFPAYEDSWRYHETHRILDSIFGA